MHTDNVGSPRAAFEYHPTANQTYYLSYGTSFDPSAEALSLTTKTANLGPEKAKSYEVGAKDQVGAGLLLSAALFHTEVDNAQTNDPENPTITLLNGDQRVEGLELQATGHITRQWELFAGYSLLDSETLSSGTAAYVGKEMPNVAHNALNLWTEYELPFGLEAGGGLNWVGRRYADSGETASLPGYVVWNAMVSYRITPDISLQLNGLNLFDRYYYSGVYYTSAAENHVIPGAGRSATLSINVKL
ncbi:MAG TPA: TonB-dependent receptor, partial [Steroidobacteraceae bacterium]|nr:TonB-dependent receptor [Steroidobacteraceae bacterium]